MLQPVYVDVASFKLSELLGVVHYYLSVGFVELGCKMVNIVFALNELTCVW